MSIIYKLTEDPPFIGLEARAYKEVSHNDLNSESKFEEDMPLASKFIQTYKSIFRKVFSQLNKIGNPKCIETNFNKLISTFNISNYDALITLKEYFSNFYYQKIQEDDKCYYDSYKNDNEFIKLIGHIKINKIDNEFIEAFNTPK
ncbi:hypothetical protein U3516DRAFT_758708 [Neocallimastix sp. 'constans']